MAANVGMISKPTLLLLPGMDGTGVLFAPVIASLQETFETVVITYPSADSLDYVALEAIVGAALPPHSDFFLLGESFSGPLAIRLAATCPRVRGLILCATFARDPRPILSGLSRLLSAIPLKWLPTRAVSALLYGRAATPALRGALALALGKLPQATLRARFNAVRHVDVSRELAAIFVPILYLRATRDLIVPRAASGYVQRCSPQMNVVDIVAPHGLLQVAPVKVVEAITAWLSEHINAD